MAAGPEAAPAARLRRAFVRRFGAPPAVVARAPGRVNLIGEHTDYNDGLVLPMAIDRAVRVALRPASGDRLRLLALDLDEAVEGGLDEPPPAPGSARWGDYLRGVAWALREHGHPVGGFDAAVHGDVPVGAGLSSSAALCVAAAFALAGAFRLPIAPKRLALYARRAETDFVGVQVGIMDQLAAALSVAGHALFIDCRDAETRPVPLPFEGRGLVIAVVDSGTRRALAVSAYNERVDECRAAVAAAAGLLPGREVRALRDLTPADLPLLEDRLPAAVFRRARHVVTENARVQAAVAALAAGDAAAFGALMTASHVSLRDDYQVSTPALDRLVELALATPGVLGARLTGAGFGGCTVNLLRRDAVPALTAAVRRHAAETGHRAGVLICRAAAGASLAVPWRLTGR
jgi:galactokinase